VGAVGVAPVVQLGAGFRGKGEGGGGCGWDVSDVVVFWGEAKWVTYWLV